MKEKVKTTSFWLSLSGVVVIVAECVSEIFNFQIGSEVVEDIVMTIASVLVLMGVVTKKNSNDSRELDKNELLLELKAEKQSEEDKLNKN